MTEENVLDAIMTPEEMVPRDRWGRPMIVPEGGGKAVAYTRCTTFVKAIDGDTSALAAWKQRMTAMGLAARKDLLMGVAMAGDGSTPESKKELNKLAEAAAEAAAASGAATIGTALHKLTERYDRGENLGKFPDEMRPDLEAYVRTTGNAGLKPVQVETFGVHDGLKVAGTWDRLNEWRGRHYIGDVKTGRVDDYSIGKIAMQLAIYSRCKRYNPATSTREEQPEVDQDRAVIIVLPAGTGTCELVWVDIKAGWEAATTLAAPARKWQSWAKMKNLTEPFVAAPAGDLPALALEQVRDAAVMALEHPEDPRFPAALGAAITGAPDLAVLTDLWNRYGKLWTDSDKAAASARAQYLKGAAS